MKTNIFIISILSIALLSSCRQAQPSPLSDWVCVQKPTNGPVSGCDRSSDPSYKTYTAKLFVDRALSRPALYLGQIGDADVVFVNGTQIGGTGQLPPSFVAAKREIRVYPIPAGSVRYDALNEITIITFGENILGRGLNTQQAKCGDLPWLRVQKTFEEFLIEGPLISSIVLLLCFIATVLMFRRSIRFRLNHSAPFVVVIIYAFFLSGLTGYLGIAHQTNLKIVMASAALLMVGVFLLDGWSDSFSSSWRRISMQLFLASSGIFLLCLPFLASPQLARSMYQLWYLFVLLGFVASFEHSKRRFGFWFLLTSAIFDMGRAKGWIHFVAPLSPWGAMIFLASWVAQHWTALLFERSKFQSERKRLQHDIRSPLSVLNAISKQLEKKDPFASEILKDSKQRLESLILDPKDQTKMALESGLEKLTQDKRVEVAQRSSNLQLNLVNDESVRGCSVATGEWQNLSRHLSNLLNNAVEASEARLPNSSNLLVTLKAYRDPRSNLGFEIVDSGFGFSPDQIARFKKADLLTTKDLGQGIGLSAARSYAKSKGGSLLIKNQPMGAVVTLVLSPNALSSNP